MFQVPRLSFLASVQRNAKICSNCRYVLRVERIFGNMWALSMSTAHRPGNQPARQSILLGFITPLRFLCTKLLSRLVTLTPLCSAYTERSWLLSRQRIRTFGIDLTAPGHIS